MEEILATAGGARRGYQGAEPRGWFSTGLRERPLRWRCYSPPMEALEQILAKDPRIAYALLFGSRARGSAHAASDLDVAVGLVRGTRLAPLDLGDLVSRLERASGHTVDLLVLDQAPLPVAYRVFRDGRLIVEKDHRALVERKVRAILEYLDFRPIEALAVRGVLSAAADGR